MSGTELATLIAATGKELAPTGTVAMLKFKDLRATMPKGDNESRSEWDKRIQDAMTKHCQTARNGAPVILAELHQRGMFMAGAKVYRDKDGNLCGVDMKLRQEQTLKRKKTDTVKDLTAKIAELTAQIANLTTPTINVPSVQA